MKGGQLMKQAIGMIEYKTTPSGIAAADKMVKTAGVKLLEAQTVCPGKYIALIQGDLAAVQAAVAAAEGGPQFISSFVLGNPHESLFPALYGTSLTEGISAVGILETFDVSSCIVGADAAAKTAVVDLIEVRIAKGMCGKSFFVISGEVAACEAAIEKAKESVAESGMYLDSVVIAHPDEQICRSIL